MHRIIPIGIGLMILGVLALIGIVVDMVCAREVRVGVGTVEETYFNPGYSYFDGSTWHNDPDTWGAKVNVSGKPYVAGVSRRFYRDKGKGSRATVYAVEGYVFDYGWRAE